MEFKGKEVYRNKITVGGETHYFVVTTFGIYFCIENSAGSMSEWKVIHTF